MKKFLVIWLVFVGYAVVAHAQQMQSFRDPKYRVSFRVPEGWKITTQDREVSSFHEDARSAGADALMRAVVAINSNPFPDTTFSGALLYFSIEPNLPAGTCRSRAAQPRGYAIQEAELNGVKFTKGRDEDGVICKEMRSEVWTTPRMNGCFRFDTVVHTFCHASTGIDPVSSRQLETIQKQFDEMLNSVHFERR